jgi:hypothetical protein
MSAVSALPRFLVSARCKEGWTNGNQGIEMEGRIRIAPLPIFTLIARRSPEEFRAGRVFKIHHEDNLQATLE